MTADRPRMQMWEDRARDMITEALGTSGWRVSFIRYPGQRYSDWFAREPGSDINTMEAGAADALCRKIMAAAPGMAEALGPVADQLAREINDAVSVRPLSAPPFPGAL